MWGPLARARVREREAQPRAMILAVLTLTISQLLDLGTFVRMVAIHGPLVEGNPLVAHLLDELGVPFLAVTKIAVLSLVIAIVAVLWGRDDQRGHPRLAAGILGFAIVAGVVGGMTNAIVLL